jgi:ribosomal protein S18 acetylase RimI-like enzyme
LSELSIDQPEIFSLNNSRLNSLHLLDQLCLPDQSWSSEAWQSLTIYGENYLVWTIYEQDELVASMLCLKLPLEDMLHLLKIMVHPNQRKRGHASNLINHLKAKALELNYKSIFLEVECDNIQAIKLYQAQGFSVLRRVAKFYSNGKDALLMNFSS